MFAFNVQNTIKHYTQSVVSMLKANTGLVRPSAMLQYRYIPICTTKQYIYKTKYDPVRHFQTYTKVYIGIGNKFIHKGHLKTQEGWSCQPLVLLLDYFILADTLIFTSVEYFLYKLYWKRRVCHDSMKSITMQISTAPPIMTYIVLLSAYEVVDING